MKKKFQQTFDEKFLARGDKVFKFTWEYCKLCRVMFVRCPVCGNNCCNATFGMVNKFMRPVNYNRRGARPCPVCNLVYEYQDLAWKTNTAPKPTKEQLKQKVTDFC